MAKISEKQKVNLLENAVVFGSIDDVRNILEEHKKIGFVARALGLAAMIGDLDKVKALVDFGADFGYNDTPSIRAAYGTVYRSRTAEYYSAYHLLPFYKGQNAAIPLLSANVSQYHFGKYDFTALPFSDDERRYAVVEFLLSKPDIFFSGEELLYYAVLWNCRNVLPLLKNHYRHLSVEYASALTQSANSIIKSELWATLMSVHVDMATEIIKDFRICLANGERILLPPHILQRDDPLHVASFLEAAFDELDFSNIKNIRLLEFAIDNETYQLLDKLLENGFADNRTCFKSALKFAQSVGNITATAMLLNYSNK